MKWWDFCFVRGLFCNSDEGCWTRRRNLSLAGLHRRPTLQRPQISNGFQQTEKLGLESEGWMGRRDLDDQWVHLCCVSSKSQQRTQQFTWHRRKHFSAFWQFLATFQGKLEKPETILFEDTTFCSVLTHTNWVSFQLTGTETEITSTVGPLLRLRYLRTHQGPTPWGFLRINRWSTPNNSSATAASKQLIDIQTGACWNAADKSPVGGKADFIWYSRPHWTFNAFFALRQVSWRWRRLSWV